MSEAAAGNEVALRRMGYVAHKGRRSIGAPEGPPSAVELDTVTRIERRTGPFGGVKQRHLDHDAGGGI